MKILRTTMLLLAIFASSQAAMADTPDNPLHNYTNRLDVDNNGSVQPRDCLLIINHIAEPTANSLALPLSSPAQFYLDTNDDSRVSAVDALLVINRLSQTPEPSTLISAGIGAVLLAGAAWRRRRTTEFAAA